MKSKALSETKNENSQPFIIIRNQRKNGTGRSAFGTLHTSTLMTPDNKE